MSHHVARLGVVGGRQIKTILPAEEADLPLHFESEAILVLSRDTDVFKLG